MKNIKLLAIVGGLIGSVILAGIVLFSIYISYSNQEVRLRNTIENKQTDNKNEFDNMFKKISQVAQVTELQKKSLMDIFNSYASARSGNGGGGSLIKWIQESVPNVDQSTFKNLQNIITSSRDSFTMRQKELLDLKREHDNLVTTFPGSFILASRGKINVTIVTSTRSENAFGTGKDDDISLIGK